MFFWRDSFVRVRQTIHTKQRVERRCEGTYYRPEVLLCRWECANAASRGVLAYPLLVKPTRRGKERSREEELRSVTTTEQGQRMEKGNGTGTDECARNKEQAYSTQRGQRSRVKGVEVG